MSAEQFEPLASTGGIGLCTVGQAFLPADRGNEEHRAGGAEGVDGQGREGSGRALGQSANQSLPYNWPVSEPCVVTSETEARRLVTAVENCRPSDVIAIIKRQPWFEEIRRGVRKTRHLAPNAYLHLSGHVRVSDRARQMSEVRRLA